MRGAKDVAGEAFEVFVLRLAHTRPFLVNDVGQDGEFAALFDVVLAPVIGEFVAGLLPGHALGNPLVAATMLLASLAGAVQ